MSDCSNHKKDVAGISDMRELAKSVGDLHYETLKDFLKCLSDKLYEDSKKDFEGGRIELSKKLSHAALRINWSHEYIFKAWQISKPFMDKPELPLTPNIKGERKI